MSTKTLSNVAEPYARALFEIALTTDKLEVFLADMGGIYELFTQSTDLTDYLNNPIYPLKTKKDILKNILNTTLKDLNSATSDFLFLLMDRGRISLIIPIVLKFRELYYEILGIKDAVCFSAEPLTPQQEKELVAALINRTGYKEIQLKVYVDPTLYAGLQVVIDSNMIDVSVRDQLTQLLEKISV
jgi:F-type H+-transporting ATPase subunit delta